jgi:DNA-binding transcriptional LysR family regulator
MADRDLDWDDLRYFLGAARAGTLAAASRAMKVEHTTIGRRLSSLEEALGAPLVLRGPEGLRLTPLGEAALPLVERVEQAVAAVRDEVSTRRARVRLAVPSGFTKLFTLHVAELQKQHPKLALELVSGARPVDLKRGEADLAVRVGTISDKDLIARKLCESGWALYAADAYLARHGTPRDLDNLAGHDVIGFDPSLARVPAAQWLEARIANANIVMRSREVTDMLAAALSGVGLCALPCMVADVEPKLTRLTTDLIARPIISLVYRREAKLSREVRAVIRMVVDVMRENADRIQGSGPRGVVRPGSQVHPAPSKGRSDDPSMPRPRSRRSAR